MTADLYMDKARELCVHMSARPSDIERIAAALSEAVAEADKQRIANAGADAFTIAALQARLADAIEDRDEATKTLHSRNREWDALVRDEHEAKKEVKRLQARLAEVERERDELDFLLHEGGTMEAQLSAAERRAEKAEAALAEAQKQGGE